MQQLRGTLWARSVWRFTKWAVGWPLAIFGIVGLPDQLTEWETFISRLAARVHAVMNDPHVVYLAEKAVEFATFVNRTPIRATLAIIGVGILIWGWGPFWNLRHRLLFSWRMLLAEESWISRDDALRLIRGSRWARLRAPSANFWDINIGGGLSESQRDQIRFDHYLDMTLESFEANRPNGVREQDGQKQYAESKLRRFVADALDGEVVDKFGKIPT